MDFSAGFSAESSFSVCRFEKGSGWYSCKSPLHAHSVNKRAHKMWQQHTSMRERERENSQVCIAMATFEKKFPVIQPHPSRPNTPLPLSWRTPPQQPLSKSQMLMLVHINTSGQISLDQTLGTPQQELYGNGECFNQSAEFYEARFWDTPNIQTCLLQTKFKKNSSFLESTPSQNKHDITMIFQIFPSQSWPWVSEEVQQNADHCVQRDSTGSSPRSVQFTLSSIHRPSCCFFQTKQN